MIEPREREKGSAVARSKLHVVTPRAHALATPSALALLYSPCARSLAEAAAVFWREWPPEMRRVNWQCGAALGTEFTLLSSPCFFC